MDFQTFTQALKQIIKSQRVILSTLGYESYFCVYMNKKDEIVLQNSSDIRGQLLGQNTGRILVEADFKKVKDQYAKLGVEERLKGANYTDPNLYLEIQRHHGPLIPALFRFVCENGYCVLGTCGNKKCLK